MSTNMTPATFRAWQDTQAFRDYRSDYGGDLSEVLARTSQVLRGSASTNQREKVDSFVSRMKQQDAGMRQYGAGRTAVSARTAALRNWGFDPTGRFTNG